MVGWKRIWEDVRLYAKIGRDCWKSAREDGNWELGIQTSVTSSLWLSLY